MLAAYQPLARLALEQFKEIVASTAFIGGTPASPNKLRLIFTDGSFLDIWLSLDGDYSFHWEQRRQRGKIFRWDNAPHHPHLDTFPGHFHEGAESNIVSNRLSSESAIALVEILEYVRQNLQSSK